jgi:hypothetical protein
MGVSEFYLQIIVGVMSLVNSFFFLEIFDFFPFVICGVTLYDLFKFYKSMCTLFYFCYRIFINFITKLCI